MYGLGLFCFLFFLSCINIKKSTCIYMVGVWGGGAEQNWASDQKITGRLGAAGPCVV